MWFGDPTSLFLLLGGLEIKSRSAKYDPAHHCTFQSVQNNCNLLDHLQEEGVCLVDAYIFTLVMFTLYDICMILCMNNFLKHQFLLKGHC